MRMVWSVIKIAIIAAVGWFAFLELRERMEGVTLWCLTGFAVLGMALLLGALNRLIERVRDLEVPGAGGSLGRDARGGLLRVRAALEFDRQWREKLAPACRERWREASRQIAGSPLYGGLELTEQYGLVPLEPDEKSGLWEFWHARTGEEPKRGGVDREWVVEEDTGMVFVLMPATATLEPFLISKYEMTQGQWARFCNDRSFYAVGTAEGNSFGIRWNHPQEQMRSREARTDISVSPFPPNGSGCTRRVEGPRPDSGSAIEPKTSRGRSGSRPEPLPAIPAVPRATTETGIPVATESMLQSVASNRIPLVSTMPGGTSPSGAGEATAWWSAADTSAWVVRSSRTPSPLARSIRSTSAAPWVSVPCWR